MSEILSNGRPQALSQSTSSAVLADAGRPMAIGELLARAVQLQQDGSLDEAKASYDDVLARQPKNVDALQFMGVLCHQEGNSKNGVKYLKKALKIDPGHPGCHNNLGAIYSDTGDYKKAEFHFRKAIKSTDVSVEAWSNLALTQRRQGHMDDALESCARASEIDPNCPKPHSMVAQIYTERHQFPEAEVAYRKCLSLTPDDVFVGNNLGYVVLMQGRFEEAENLFAEALDRAGDSPQVSYNLRFLKMREGKFEEAREMFREHLRANPENWTSELGLALGLAVRGMYEEAFRNMKDILELFPDDIKVWRDVGKVLISLEKFQDAIEVLNKAAEIDPEFSGIQNDLGGAYIQQNMFVPAIFHLKKAIALEPDNINPYLNLCRALRGVSQFDQADIFGRAAFDLDSYETKYFPGVHQLFRGLCDYEYLEKIGDPLENAAGIMTQHLPAVLLNMLVEAGSPEELKKLFGLVRSWGKYVEQEVENNPLPARERGKPGEKLRIGFLSSDLRRHSVSRFLTGLMRYYDRERFEFYCYSPIEAVGDTLQILIRDNVDQFTFVKDQSPREVAVTIQKDDLDILLELNGFTTGTRVEALAYKPAPVQMSWLGYPFSCGLKAIDHVLVDEHIIGAEGERYLIEEPVNMPEGWVCFGNFADVPIQSGLPLDRNGTLTFGTLNNVYKYTPAMIANWAKVMQRVPDSRFLVVRPEMDSLVICKNIAEQFEKNGIGPDRLFFFNNRDEKANHLTYYNEIDVDLDTFPLTGGTTTCEALWMGVPVISSTLR